MSTSSASEDTWSGVPLSEIYGSQSPWGAPEFPLVTPAYNHTVLYHIPSNRDMPDDKPPQPQIGHDKWDQEHVRLPCSPQSLYPCESNNGDTRLRKRWELIQYALWQPIRNTEQLANAILSYNTKFKDIWTFRALKKLFNEYLEEDETQYFFDVTLPEIAKLALALPTLIQSPIPLLKKNKNHSISLSQQQISSLLANAFFCTFPRRNATKRTSEYAQYPHINFNRLYESDGSDNVLEKLKCICHYFRRVCTKVPAGAVSFCRRAARAADLPRWGRSAAPVAAVPLHVDWTRTIEDAHGLIQVDFANKYLGGGVLNYGCVQEEIRFVICPELMISMLFTEVLQPNEVLMMIGCERYSRYIGYGDSFTWAGEYCDPAPRDGSLRRRTAVLALDAAPHPGNTRQFRRDLVERELNKAWVGFSMWSSTEDGRLSFPGVATGNWGCGAFGGRPDLKWALQLAAAAVARRPLAYYTFGDRDLPAHMMDVYRAMAARGTTVGQLYNYILKFPQVDSRCTDFHAYLLGILNEDPSKSISGGPEKMDMSTSEQACEAELSSSLQEEFLDSPDLFTQDDTDDSLVEIKIENNPEQTFKQTDKQTSSQTSRLFTEMEKLDEENGTLNVSGTKKSPFKLNTANNSNTSMDTGDHAKTDATSELKKTVSRKITDYFSKKS